MKILNPEALPTRLCCLNFEEVLLSCSDFRGSYILYIPQSEDDNWDSGLGEDWGVAGYYVELDISDEGITYIMTMQKTCWDDEIGDLTFISLVHRDGQWVELYDIYYEYDCPKTRHIDHNFTWDTTALTQVMIEIVEENPFLDDLATKDTHDILDLTDEELEERRCQLLDEEKDIIQDRLDEDEDWEDDGEDPDLEDITEQLNNIEAFQLWKSKVRAFYDKNN